MPFARRHRFNWQLRTRSLDLGQRTLVMGILNVTPDSFSDGGQHATTDAAFRRALTMFAEGMDILDLGGESTRPNASPITAEEEQARVLPVIAAILQEKPDAILSIDTFHASTARAAIEAGAELVNDVSGFLWDPSMAAACAELHCGAVLMHARGKPQEWAALPALSPEEMLPLVFDGLCRCLNKAQKAGLPPEKIVLDPGFGFGKRGEENYVLHAVLEELHPLGYPLLVGTSRKGFLGKTLAPLYDGEAPPMSQRIHASTASNVAAILSGAHILRVHDVRPAVEAAAIADGILLAAETLPEKS